MYTPNYYQPMQDTLAQMRQPYMQQPQQQAPGIVWVQGETGAKSYLVGAGQSVMLMDSENSRFYIKTTDQSGMPLPLRTFEYVEKTKPSEAYQSAPKTTDEYITRKEFEEAIEKLKGAGRDEPAV